MGHAHAIALHNSQTRGVQPKGEAVEGKAVVENRGGVMFSTLFAITALCPFKHNTPPLFPLLYSTITSIRTTIIYSNPSSPSLSRTTSSPFPRSSRTIPQSPFVFCRTSQFPHGSLLHQGFRFGPDPLAAKSTIIQYIYKQFPDISLNAFAPSRVRVVFRRPRNQQTPLLPLRSPRHQGGARVIRRAS